LIDRFIGNTIIGGIISSGISRCDVLCWCVCRWAVIAVPSCVVWMVTSMPLNVLRVYTTADRVLEMGSGISRYDVLCWCVCRWAVIAVPSCVVWMLTSMPLSALPGLPAYPSTTPDTAGLSDHLTVSTSISLTYLMLSS